MQNYCQEGGKNIINDKSICYSFPAIGAENLAFLQCFSFVQRVRVVSGDKKGGKYLKSYYIDEQKKFFNKI